MHNIDRARNALHALDSGCPRDEWVSLAMAAKAAGLAFDDFHSWSEPAHNYRNEHDCRNVWKSIAESGGIGAGTLFAKARDAGWSEPVNGHERRKARERQQSGKGADGSGGRGNLKTLSQGCTKVSETGRTSEKLAEKAQEPRRPSGEGKASSFDFAAVWRDSEPAAHDHPYIARKLGLPDGLRVYRGPPLVVSKQALDGALLDLRRRVSA